MTIDDIITAPPTPGELFDAQAAFKSPGPFELEIGCGKGGFLLRRAREHGDIRFLGIEWANKYFRFAADRMARWRMDNVRIMRTDARQFVIHHLAPLSVAVLHVYHPDPWPKKRHHKRRLFQADFVSAACRALTPGGRWAIQTDHTEYFEWIKQQMAQACGLEPMDFDDPRFGIIDSSAATNFEVKYRRQDRPIYQLAYRKRPVHDDDSPTGG